MAIKLTDTQVEQTMGNLLRAGVLVAAAVVVLGGILYLVKFGSEPPNYRLFHGEPADLRSPTRIVKGAVDFRSRALIQLGLLLLIATPVARVIFSVYAFLRQRDYIYVVLTLIVLAVLLYSLFFGYSKETDEPAASAADSSGLASTVPWHRPR
jgi:uncharacterized membrane protein